MNGEKQGIEVLNDAAALARTSPDELATAIERRNQLMDKIRDAALKSTFSEQWCDMDGKPWPTASAAETIARRCAVKLHSTRYERLDRADDGGAFYMYVYTGTVELPGKLDSAEVVGTCSSRDQFIGTETQAGRELSEINEDDILKAAYSNLVVNGVMRLLGLRGQTWERLKPYGIEQGKASKIEHRTGGRGGGKNVPHADRSIPFGDRLAGKKIGDPTIDPADLKWLRGAMERGAADPKNEKWRDDNLAWVKAIDEELARRAAAKGAAPAAAGGGEPPRDKPPVAAASGSPGPAQPSVWMRIRALEPTIPEAILREMVKTATKKVRPMDLTEDDLAKVQAAIADARKSQGEQIPF